MPVSIPQRLAISWQTLTGRVSPVAALPSLDRMGDVRGKRVLLRGALNVPLREGKVANDYRLRSLLPTIARLRDWGARVVLVGHIGRTPEDTLRSVYEHLRAHLPLSFVGSVVGTEVEQAVSALSEGDVLMLENVRSHPGEQANDASFAEALAALADVYVNDAFAGSHRAHASIVGVPKRLPSFAGIQLVREVEELTKALQPLHPSVFVVGGAKFATKEPLIRKFLGVYDTVCIGGALANDFFRAQGFEIGASLVSKDVPDLTSFLAHPGLVLPRDVVVEKRDGSRVVKPADDISEDERVSDIGTRSTQLFSERVGIATSVVWNGPLGNFERGFGDGTCEIARAVAHVRGNTLVGGGDTLAAISHLELEDRYTFVSTGGGAMLQFLVDETLPGIEALQR